MLLERACGRGRTWLIAHGSDPADNVAAREFERLSARRREGEPIAYLIGEREFHGVRLRVDPAVLIPRPETEVLVDEAIRRLPPSGRLLDLGTGSGAIAVAVAAARPDVSITATDRSAAALERARENGVRCLPAGRAGGAPLWLEGDWWGALRPDSPAFDLVVSNPPYIAEGDPHLSRGDLRFEPVTALVGGPDGLRAITAILSGAVGHLRPGGRVLIEHGFEQGEAVRSLAASFGLDQVHTLQDAGGRERVTAGRNPAV